MKLCTVFLLTICLVMAGIYVTQAQPSVCIDAGHGGDDSGAVGHGLLEKSINLDVANRFHNLLKNAGYTVYMTRSSDKTVSLSSRTSYANSVGAGRFISIHCNAFNQSAHGTETYCYTSGSSTSFRMRDKTQPQMVAALGTYDRGCKTAGFYVIKYTNMPAILAELAFIDNAGDAAKLGDAGYRQKAAEALKRGLEQSREEEQTRSSMQRDSYYLAPRFSPDGSKILASKAGYHGLYIISLAGEVVRTLSDEAHVGYQAQWIANDQIRYGKADALFTATLDGRVARANDRQEMRVFAENGEIWLETYGERQQLTNSGDIYFNPSLSPDNKHVVYEGIESGIHVCTLTGDDTVIGRGNHPAWLPDSKGLVFDVTEDDGQEITASTIALVLLESSQNRFALTTDSMLLAQRACVSADGKQLVFDARGKLFLARLHGFSIRNCQEIKIVE